VALSIHFGIYLFTDIGKTLHSPLALKIIDNLTNNNSGQKKLIIFAEEGIDIPQQISHFFKTIHHRVTEPVTQPMIAS